MSRPSCSFSALLRLAASENVDWLSGADSNVLLNWVTTELNVAQSGEAFLLEGSDLTPAVVDVACGRGVVAIVVLGTVKKPHQFQDVCLPIACIPAQQDLQATQRMLLTILINQRAHLMERGINIHARLAQMAAEGAGLQGLVAEMTELSGRGVVVQDKRMDVLTSSTPPTLNAVWEDVLAQLTTRDSLPEVLQDRKEAGRQNVFHNQNLQDGLTRLVTSINVGGMARGYLSLVGVVGELDTLDQVVAEQGAMVCAVEMSRSKAVRETEKRLKSDLLTALLQGELSPRDARLWTETMGLDLSQAHTCLRCSWGSASPPSLRRLETLVNSEITRLGFKVIVSTMEAEVICFCQAPAGETRPEQVITLGRSITDRATLNYPDSQLRCGIGTPADSLDDWRNSFHQAGQALDMARRLGEAKPLFFPDLSVYRLLLQIEHSTELRTFQEEILGPLMAYENGKELIRTLEIYFERNGNLKKTSNTLYIHRNTLIYRLERIQEITGLDLNDPETRLALQLTLHIRRMLGGAGGVEGEN